MTRVVFLCSALVWVCFHSILFHEIPWYDWVYKWLKNILVAEIPWYDWVCIAVVMVARGAW